jgi:serine/threonine protein kinase
MCKVKPDGTFDQERCHSVVNLDEFGIAGLTGRGCIADNEWLSGVDVPCHVSAVDPSCVLCLPDRKVYVVLQIEHGTYGYIKGARRVANNHTDAVILKQPKTAGVTLLSEALIQKVVYDSLIRGGFRNGAAQVYDILRLRDGTVCFTMERMYGKNLQWLIEDRIGFDLVNLIIECLIHISAMLSYLMNDIGMNHRDLKPSNIILHEHDPIEKTFTVAGISITFLSRFDVSFIDFGFSCVGIEGGKGGGDLRAGKGKGYLPNDPCPKDGRDIYMFLAFIYFYTCRKLSCDMNTLFERWLNVGDCNMTGFLSSPADPEDNIDVLTWIYRITGDPRVQRFKTTPERIFTDLTEMTARSPSGRGSGGAGSAGR